MVLRVSLGTWPRTDAVEKVRVRRALLNLPTHCAFHRLDALLVQCTRAVNNALPEVAFALGWILSGARF